jgi:hypothetical protein
MALTDHHRRQLLALLGPGLEAARQRAERVRRAYLDVAGDRAGAERDPRGWLLRLQAVTDRAIAWGVETILDMDAIAPLIAFRPGELAAMIGLIGVGLAALEDNARETARLLAGRRASGATDRPGRGLERPRREERPMLLTFCEFSDRADRRPAAIDPLQVVALRRGTREVTRGKATEAVNVLTVGLADGTEYVIFDASRIIAKRIIRAKAAALGRPVGAELL